MSSEVIIPSDFAVKAFRIYLCMMILTAIIIAKTYKQLDSAPTTTKKSLTVARRFSLPATVFGLVII